MVILSSGETNQSHWSYSFWHESNRQLVLFLHPPPFFFLPTPAVLMLVSWVHPVWSLCLGRCLGFFYFLLLIECNGISTAVLYFWCLGSPEVWKGWRRKWNGNFVLKPSYNDLYFFWDGWGSRSELTATTNQLPTLFIAVWDSSLPEPPK